MNKFIELTKEQVCIYAQIEDYSKDEYKPNSVNSVCVPFRLYRSCVRMLKLFIILIYHAHCIYMVITKTSNNNTCVRLLPDLRQ